MHFLFFFLCFISSTICFSQSKKKQIEILNNRFDSLYQALIFERNTNFDKLTNLNSTLTDLQYQLQNYQQKNAELTKNFELKQKDCENELKSLSDEINQKNKFIDSISIDNSNKEIYEERLVFISNGNLYQQFIGSNETKPTILASSGKIISFISVGNYLYYGELSGFNLLINRIDLRTLNKELFVTIFGEQVERYFISQLSELGEITKYNNNSLIILANFECCDAAGFRDQIILNLETRAYNKMDDNDFYRINIITNFNEVDFINTSWPDSYLISQKSGNQYELFMPLSNGDFRKLSNTQFISSRECWGEEVDYFNYSYLQNGKILFYLISDCGDLAHGSLFLVNDDGSNQVNLADNFIFGIDNDIYKSLKDNSIYFLDMNQNIILYQGNNNLGKIIAKNVSCFKVINGI
jgi:hypothetical protein